MVLQWLVLVRDSCAVDRTYSSISCYWCYACNVPRAADEDHIEAVDWWALGVFIFEMMCADHVFFVDEVDVVQSIIHEQLFRQGTCRAEDITRNKCLHGMHITEFRTRKVEAPWNPPEEGRSRKERTISWSFSFIFYILGVHFW